MIHVVEKDAANLSTPSGPGVNIPQFLVLIFSDPISFFHEGNESFFLLPWGAIIISGGCFIILISENLAASESSIPLYLDPSNPSELKPWVQRDGCDVCRNFTNVLEPLFKGAFQCYPKTFTVPHISR